MTATMEVVTDNDAHTKSSMTPCKLRLKSVAGSVQISAGSWQEFLAICIFKDRVYSSGICRCVVLDPNYKSCL